MNFTMKEKVEAIEHYFTSRGYAIVKTDKGMMMIKKQCRNCDFFKRLIDKVYKTKRCGSPSSVPCPHWAFKMTEMEAA